MKIAVPTSFKMTCINADTPHMASLFCFNCNKFTCDNCNTQIHDASKKHDVKSIFDLYATMIMTVCLNCKNASEINEVTKMNCNKQFEDDFVKELEVLKTNVKVNNLSTLLKEMSDLYDNIFKEAIYFKLVNKIKEFNKKFRNIFNSVELLKADTLITKIKSIKDVSKTQSINEDGNVKSLVKKFTQGTAKVVNTKKMEIVQSISKKILDYVKIYDKPQSNQQSNIKSTFESTVISQKKAEEKKPEMENSNCSSTIIMKSSTMTESTEGNNENSQSQVMESINKSQEKENSTHITTETKEQITEGVQGETIKEEQTTKEEITNKEEITTPTETYSDQRN